MAVAPDQMPRRPEPAAGARERAPRVVLVLPSGTYRAPDFMAAAAAIGAEVVVATEFRQAMGETMGTKAIQVDLCAPVAAAAAIVESARGNPVDAVLAVDDQGTEVAALAAASLGLPHNDPGAVRAARDKAQLRRRLARAGVPQPAFRVLGRRADVGKECSRVGWPVVVKPVSLAASRGVIRADDPHSAVAVVERVRGIARSAGRPEEEPLLVEGFVRGPEIAVEGVLNEGRLAILAVFDKPDPLDGPYFEETIYVTPSRQDAEVLDRAREVLEAAIRALGLTEGPVHAELRLASTGPVVLEVAARSIGGRCSRTLRFGAGMSLEELILRQALGRGPEPLRPSTAASGVMMLPIPVAGYLHGVSGLDAARATPLIEGIEVSIHRGGRVVPLPEGDRYLGFAFAAGPDPDRVEAALRSAWSRLAFDIRTEPLDAP